MAIFARMGQLPVYIRKLSNEMELPGAHTRFGEVVGAAESDPHASSPTLDPQSKKLMGAQQRRA